MLTGTGNFKPRLRNNQSAKIQSARGPADSRVNLTIKDGDDGGEYEYSGAQQPSQSCVLIYNSSTKSLVLEKLDVDFTFNLQTTPTNHDRSQVTGQYPKLDTGASDVESDGGSNADAPSVDTVDHAEADANNPYDYRHFLKRRRSSSPEVHVSQHSGSPAVPPRRLSRTNNKPKPRPRPQQQRPRRPTREEANTDGNDSDDGGLTIDMGDSPPPRRFGSGAVVFNHDRRNGPISLRSAASSMSPASIKHDSGNEAESDNDVEHLELPSPQRRPDREEDEGDDDGDDDDELVEDLIMQAMESQEEEEEEGEENPDSGTHKQVQAVERTVEESSSSSEEE